MTNPPSVLVKVWIKLSLVSIEMLIFIFHVDISQMSSDELKETQTIMEEKVYRIWTVLSAFEGMIERRKLKSGTKVNSTFF